jgi:hypothetical protein
MTLQQGFQTLPNDGVVIDQKYANCHSVSVPSGGDRPDDSPHVNAEQM